MSDLMAVLLAIAFVAFVVSLANWRLSLLGVVVIGFFQDPLRKITPGEPVIFVVLCTVVMLLALLGAMMRHGVISIEPIASGHPATRAVLRLVIAVVALQGVLSWIRYGSPIIAAIGIFSYLSPIPAIWLAYHYTRNPADIRRFLGLYVVGTIVVAVGIYLSEFGLDSPLFRQVGPGMVLYDPVLGLLDTHPGFMRSPEIAAWHVGAGACLMIVLAVSAPTRWWRLAAPWAAPLFLAASVLTGRRKVLVIVASFVAIYLGLLYYFRNRPGRRVFMLVFVPSAVCVCAAMFMAPSGNFLRPYIERGQTAFGDAEERFTDLGLASVGWALYRGGFFGLGAGAGSQGTQHFFADGRAIAGGAAEGGLGKVAVELGIPGLVLVTWALWLVARNVWRVLRVMAARDDGLFPLCAGLVAFCAANVPVFIGASQVYGDPFVLTLLGSFLGFVLAVARLHQLSLSGAA